jgi:hypothetical protein
MNRNSYSCLRPIQFGVPQWSLVGTALSNIYINEFPSAEHDSNVVISVYDDDMKISVRSDSTDIPGRKLTLL